MEGTWTITELAEQAVQALASGESMQVNGRVRDLPNERLIRWYTTIGLVDPPLGRRGRAATYGPRHLLQIVAVKRRQSEGRSIAEIQLELAGATDEALQRIARLSDAPTPSPRQRFWTPTDVSWTPADPQPVPHTPKATVVQGVRLAPDLTVLLNVPALSDDDLAAIEAAARPLLDELRRRGLIDTSAPTPGRSQ
ncbi:MerR family transcriptional regulator [Spirillospora sp. CA-294931]|uniref:MerR family transcriptional regulator n=1 Tax=Spirillospora sp. CA-294931 TaxID=3240042 RepID=UPI003D90EB43